MATPEEITQNAQAASEEAALNAMKAREEEEKARREEAARNATQQGAAQTTTPSNSPAAVDEPAPQQSSPTTDKKPGLFSRIMNTLGLTSGTATSPEKADTGLQPIGIIESPAEKKAAFKAKPPLFEIRSVDSALGAEAISGNKVSVVTDAEERWNSGRALENQLSEMDSRLASKENSIRISYDRQISGIFSGGYRDGGAAIDAQAAKVREIISSVNYQDYQPAEGETHSNRMAKLDLYIGAKQEQARQLASIGAGEVISPTTSYKSISEEAAEQMKPKDTSIERYREVARQLREFEGDKNKIFNESSNGQKMSEGQQKSFSDVSSKMLRLQEEKALIENSADFQKRAEERVLQIDARQKEIDEKKAELKPFDALFEKARTETLTTEEKEKFGPMIEKRRDLLREESALKNERLDLVQSREDKNSEVTRSVLQNVKERTENQIADDRLKEVNDNFTQASKSALASTTAYMDRLVEARSEAPTGVGGWNAGAANEMIGQAKFERDNKLAPVASERAQIDQARSKNYAANLNIDTMVDANNSKGPDLSKFIVQKNEAGQVTQLNMPADARLEIIPAGLGEDGKRNYNMRIVGSSDAAFKTVTINNVSSSQLKTLINAGDEGTLRVVFRGDANKAPELNITSNGAQVEYTKVKINAVGTDLAYFEEAGRARDRRAEEALLKRTEEAQRKLAMAEMRGNIKDLEEATKRAGMSSEQRGRYDAARARANEEDLGRMAPVAPGRTGGGAQGR
jgi:hypothetical protein